MDKQSLIVGIVFIAVGAILFFMGQAISNSIDYRMNYYFGGGSNWAPVMSMFGIILLIVGFIVTVVGAVTEEKKKKPLNDVHCQICGKSKGFDQFYLVTKGGRSLNVCEQCADEIEKGDKEGNNKTVASQDDALKVLKLRYAKGEITKEQFEQMKKDLEV